MERKERGKFKNKAFIYRPPPSKLGESVLRAKLAFYVRHRITPNAKERMGEFKVDLEVTSLLLIKCSQCAK